MDDNDARDRLADEMAGCTISDLETILRTQKELYSEEEMAIIQEILQKKKTALKLTDDEMRFAVTMFCIAGLLSPAAGVVIGIIMLIKGAKGHPRWMGAAKKTFLAVFISILIWLFLYSGGFHV